MVYWITGRAGSGKTTFAKRMVQKYKAVLLDGDDMRKRFGFTEFTDHVRFLHLRNITQIAKLLEDQGFTVVIACVSPNREERRVFQSQFNDCQEIYIPGGSMWPGTIYEEPDDGRGQEKTDSH